MQEGLDLNGMEGELMEVIEKYQGKQLSANLPYKTLFMIPTDDGKDQKLIAHLVRDNVKLFLSATWSIYCSSMMLISILHARQR